VSTEKFQDLYSLPSIRITKLKAMICACHVTCVAENKNARRA
jgi:hypothetical protein